MGPVQKTVLVGDQLTLTCDAIGVPKPSVTWAKDDINVEFGDRIQVWYSPTVLGSCVQRRYSIY